MKKLDKSRVVRRGWRVDLYSGKVQDFLEGLIVDRVLSGGILSMHNKYMRVEIHARKLGFSISKDGAVYL